MYGLILSVLAAVEGIFDRRSTKMSFRIANKVGCFVNTLTCSAVALCALHFF